MNLKILSRNDLDIRIKNLAQRERTLLGEVLLTIQEIDKRRLYLDMGYANLFYYLTEGVGYSGGSAQRRIDGARLLNEVPELDQKIRSGQVSLNQVSLFQKAIRENNKKPIDEVKRITARDKQDFIAKLENKNYLESQKMVANFLDLPIVHNETKKAQADASIRMELTLSPELFSKINLAQELLSHSLPDKSLVAYLEYVTAKVIQQKSAKANKAQMVNANIQCIGNKNDHLNPEKSTATVAVKSTVKISLSVRKQILNPKASCQYQDPQTQKKCGSRWHLQVDHKQSQWSGGSHQIANLQVLCANHNQLKYRQEQGICYIS